MSRVRLITELCGLRVSVESYLAPKGAMQCKRCSASDTRSETAVTHHGASRVGASNCRVGAEPRRNSLSAVAVGETTQRTTVAV